MIEETVIEETVADTVSSTEADETFAEDPVPLETVAMTTEPEVINVIIGVGSDIVHVNLFGSFLVCGTLVGLFILRKIYGT